MNSENEFLESSSGTLEKEAQPLSFNDIETVKVRILTQRLGRTVEKALLGIWERNTLRNPQRRNFSTAIPFLISELNSTIGERRLRPPALHEVYIEVIARNQTKLKTLFTELDNICNFLKIYDPGISFLEGLEFINDLTYQYKRYWLDAALMIGKEILAPSLELEDYSLLVKGVPVGNGLVVFDGFAVPFWPGIQERNLAFDLAQKNSLNWVLIEIKAVFAWWRNVGKDPLQLAPEEHIRRLDDKIEQVARYVGDEYYPPYAELLYCGRGWRASRLFVRLWDQENWALIE